MTTTAAAVAAVYRARYSGRFVCVLQPRAVARDARACRLNLAAFIVSEALPLVAVVRSAATTAVATTAVGQSGPTVVRGVAVNALRAIAPAFVPAAQSTMLHSRSGSGFLNLGIGGCTGRA